MSENGDSLVVTVLVDELVWTETQDLQSANSEDTVFSVGAEGTIVFGDGVHGHQPSPGSQVTVSWRQGGGEAGDTQVTFTTSWPFRDRSYQIVSGRKGVRINPVFDCSESDSGEKRVRYFTGQVLSASEFQTEQQYFREKLRRHNKFLHGQGVVTGLELSVSQRGGSSYVVVSPGYGISAEGEELSLRHPLELEINAQVSPQYVALRYGEIETDPVPTLNPDRSMPSRIEERVLACLVAEQESGVGVMVGRVLSSDSGWVVDAEFPVPRRLGPVE